MPNGNVFEQLDAQAARMSDYDAALALNNARRKLTQAISDETTDKTTIHLTKPLKRQVIGYSHSTKLANNASQVAGYDETTSIANRK